MISPAMGLARRLGESRFSGRGAPVGPRGDMSGCAQLQRGQWPALSAQRKGGRGWGVTTSGPMWGRKQREIYIYIYICPCHIYLVTYGWSMGDLWVIYEWCMGDVWLIYGWCMGDVWHWCLYELTMFNIQLVDLLTYIKGMEKNLPPDRFRFCYRPSVAGDHGLYQSVVDMWFQEASGFRIQEYFHSARTENRRSL